jgi:hypothetical protein
VPPLVEQVTLRTGGEPVPASGIAGAAPAGVVHLSPRLRAALVAVALVVAAIVGLTALFALP